MIRSTCRFAASALLAAGLAACGGIPIGSYPKLIELWSGTLGELLAQAGPR